MLANGGSLLSGLLTEVLCHKIISSSSSKDRAHFVELHGILQDERRVIFAMPLMHCDLLAVIRGRCDRTLTRRWVAQLALGIDALHRMGIIHRDIKPENILLDAPDGNVRITDLNAAFVSPWNAPLEDGAVYARELTGSMPYMAWEVTKRRWYGKMVDWWALGCVMFDLVTGSILFKHNDTRAEYVKWDRKAERRSYVAWRDKGKMSGEEESVISGLISVYPGARFQLRHLRHHAYFFDEHR
ncbi:kinase-like protein [Trametes cingulata]|nr:kinase-like protein [Trametes cingulata]